MLTLEDQSPARKRRVLPPVKTIAVLTLMLVVGLVVLVQAMMSEQSGKFMRAAVSGLLTQQQAIADRASIAWAAAPDPEQAYSTVRQLDYALILEANGQTRRAWLKGEPTVADGLGLIGPTLSQMLDASLTAPQSGQTQSGLGVIRGQLAVVSVTPLPDTAQPRRLLVVANVLSSDILSDLGQRSEVKDLRFENSRWVKPAPDSILIRFGHNPVFGRLVWTNPNAGFMPAHLWPLAIGVLGALVFLVAYSLRASTRSARKLDESEARTRYISTHDPLTQMANRTYFMDNLKASLARLRRTKDKLAILLIDLDLFKEVNDTLGHAVGDALLRGCAQRFVASLDSTNVIARLGGDLFAIQTSGGDQALEIDSVCARLDQAFQAPFEIDGHQIRITLSIGGAIAPDHSLDAEGLFKRADLALMRVKANGRNGHHVFDREMSRRLDNRHRLERDLRIATQVGDQFVLYYQPQLDLQTGNLSSLEALIRWNHPELGQIPPADFIPLAEETGLIAALGDWVIGQACRDAQRWPDIRVAVNVSPAQFRESRLIDVVKSALESSGIDARQLELEITENVLYANPQRTRELLTGLQALGTELAMDDFGTGYSNLAQLGSFWFNTLKLDRSFVSRIGQDPYIDGIVVAILTLAQTLGLRTVAEGIETEAQARFLSQHKCGLGQGYLFSRPLSVDQLEDLLVTRARFWKRAIAA